MKLLYNMGGASYNNIINSPKISYANYNIGLVTK